MAEGAARPVAEGTRDAPDRALRGVGSEGRVCPALALPRGPQGVRGRPGRESPWVGSFSSHEGLVSLGPWTHWPCPCGPGCGCGCSDTQALTAGDTQLPGDLLPHHPVEALATRRLPCSWVTHTHGSGLHAPQLPRTSREPRGPRGLCSQFCDGLRAATVREFTHAHGPWGRHRARLGGAQSTVQK